MKKFDDLRLSASICSYFITSSTLYTRPFFDCWPVGSGLVYNVEVSKRFHPSSSLSTQLLIVVIVLLLVLLHTNKSL